MTTIIAPIAQLVERWSYEPEVEGSNPSGSTSVFSFFYAAVHNATIPTTHTLARASVKGGSMQVMA